ncbi:unnamed protein product, partial [Coregonus sp. 'balchen']
MLQQILKDMYIDPDVLEALNEDQKKTLFLKMREEQVRRWTEREEKDGDHRPKSKTANSKKVSWLLGRDGDVAVMVIGEVDELKTSKLLCTGPVERRAPPSLHNNTRHQTTSLKSNLVNRPASETIRTQREDLPPKTQPGIQLNLKQAELKQDVEVDAPQEKPVLLSYRPHPRAGPSNLRLGTTLSSIPKSITITPSPVPSSTPSPVPTVTQSPVPKTNTPVPTITQFSVPKIITPSTVPSIITPSPVTNSVTPSPVPISVTPSPVPSSNAIRDALEKGTAKAHATEKTITQSPVPSPITLSPVPSPITQSPVPSPITLSPVPSPITLSPVPSPITLSPVPSPITLSPVPSPIVLTITPSPVVSSTAIREALKKSTAKTRAPEKTTVTPLSVTTRPHPQEPAEPHPQETPSSREGRTHIPVLLPDSGPGRLALEGRKPFPSRFPDSGPWATGPGRGPGNVGPEGE